MSTNSVSLPHDKALFDSDLSKLFFVRKKVPMIRTLSSKIECTISKRELRWTFETQKYWWKWPEDGLECHLAVATSRITIAANGDVLPRAELVPASLAPSNLSPLAHICRLATMSVDRPWPLWRERKREKDDDGAREGRQRTGREEEVVERERLSWGSSVKVSPERWTESGGIWGERGRKRERGRVTESPRILLLLVAFKFFFPFMREKFPFCSPFLGKNPILPLKKTSFYM